MPTEITRLFIVYADRQNDDGDTTELIAAYFDRRDAFERQQAEQDKTEEDVWLGSAPLMDAPPGVVVLHANADALRERDTARQEAEALRSRCAALEAREEALWHRIRHYAGKSRENDIEQDADGVAPMPESEASALATARAEAREQALGEAVNAIGEIVPPDVVQPHQRPAWRRGTTDAQQVVRGLMTTPDVGERGRGGL